MSSTAMPADSSAAPPDLTIEGEERTPDPDDPYYGCLSLLCAFVDAGSSDLYQAAHDKLFTLARDAVSDAMQRECFDAMQEVQSLQATIQAAFVRNIESSFAVALAADLDTDERSAGEDGVAALSLYDTQSLDDELQLARITQQARAFLRDSDTELAQRISGLLPIPVTAEDNPAGLQALANAFHGALQDRGLSGSGRRALYGAFADVVVARLPAVQRELLALLRAHAVDAIAPDTSDGSGDTADQRARRQCPPRGSATVPPHRATVHPSRSRPGVSFGGAVQSGRHAISMLRALDNAAPLSATTVDDEVAPKVTQTLDFVLAQIQQSGVALNWGRRGRFALARRLRKELAGYGVEIADPTVIDLVAMVDRLFDGIVTDRYLNPVARGRICALALPVLRIALGDATFFASDAHPARTTINLTARIAAYHGSADSSEQEIGQRAEDVIRDLLARPTCCSGAFAQTNEALEPLLDAQRQLREQRITALLAKLGQADRTRAPAENGPETAPGEDEHDATWRSLELLVSRLAVGDWMLVTNADGKSRCARLEWFSPGRTHVGLADELGHEVTTLECAGLIDAAMSGDIVIADEISMPLTERAMYGVLQSLHHDIRLKATVDPATGTANRRHLESEIVRLMRVPPRRKRSHYACWIGIDTYTTTLQQHGDTTAARLEKQYAASLRRQLGSEAVLGRIEKGAFLAVIADQSDAHMQQLTRQLQRAARLSKCTLRGEDIDFGISIGVTRLPEEVSDVDRFLNRANEAYTAARGTEDRIFLAPAPATDRHAGSPQILQLIESGALSLRCQKILPIDNARALPYYEVLLGVRAPDGSINPPGNVIQMAEACGDICELDRWVVNTALTTMQANPDWLGTIDGLSINLSGTSLSNRELLEYITGAVAGSGVPAAKIIFEITESATITQLEIAQNFVTTLRETGCRFALDDFGAAHASYSYLKLLPVDTIKIDGLFISDITNSPADEAMVRSMADIARVLGKKTVAEFVGDAATFELMRDIGIDYGQGFWIEKPRPIEEAIACSATGGPE